LLSAEEEKEALKKHRENRDKLRVPRRCVIELAFRGLEKF